MLAADAAIPQNLLAAVSAVTAAATEARRRREEAERLERDILGMAYLAMRRQASVTEFLGASLAIYGGVSPSRPLPGAARRSQWSGLAIDVLLDDR